MKTDYEKVKMSIKRALKTVWFGNLKFAEIKESSTRDWFLKNTPPDEDPITYAYFLGRQDGRVSLGTEVARCIGMDDEDILALKETE